MAGKLQVTELDFDNIKTNLKTYLKGQSEFSDYNFEGSGLSTLVDLLAYNTHYLAMNANYFTNEKWVKRGGKGQGKIRRKKSKKIYGPY